MQALLFDLAESRNRPAATEFFLPYLSGERTPHNDPHAKGVFFGLDARIDIPDRRASGARGRRLRVSRRA